MTRAAWWIAGAVACACVLLAGVGWISATTLRLEGAEAQARGRAEVEERVRLALWRLDGAATPLVAGDAARFVRVRFRVDPDGALSLDPGYTGEPPPVGSLGIRRALVGTATQ